MGSKKQVVQVNRWPEVEKLLDAGKDDEALVIAKALVLEMDALWAARKYKRSRAAMNDGHTVLARLLPLLQARGIVRGILK